MLGFLARRRQPNLLVICRYTLNPDIAQHIRDALKRRRDRDLLIEVPEGFELYQLVAGRWVSIDPYETLRPD
jgi:hypothetical protein